MWTLSLLISFSSTWLLFASHNRKGWIIQSLRSLLCSDNSFYSHRSHLNTTYVAARSPLTGGRRRPQTLWWRILSPLQSCSHDPRSGLNILIEKRKRCFWLHCLCDLEHTCEADHLPENCQILWENEHITYRKSQVWPPEWRQTSHVWLPDSCAT